MKLKQDGLHVEVQGCSLPVPSPGLIVVWQNWRWAWPGKQTTNSPAVHGSTAVHIPI